MNTFEACLLRKNNAWSNKQEATVEMSAEKRENDRHQTLGLMLKITDGTTDAIGVVEDISYHGLCVSQIPKIFDENVATCFALVKGPEQDLRVALTTKWFTSTNNGMYKKIGFKILDPPSGWTRFVNELACETNPLYCMLLAGTDEG